MAIRRCPYCKAIIDESQKYCNNCGTQLLFPEEESPEEEIKGEKILDEDFKTSAEDDFEASLDVPGEEALEVEKEVIDLQDILEGGVTFPGEKKPASVSLEEEVVEEEEEKEEEEAEEEEKEKKGKAEIAESEEEEKEEEETAAKEQTGEDIIRSAEDKLRAAPEADLDLGAEEEAEIEAEEDKVAAGGLDFEAQEEIGRIIAEIEKRKTAADTGAPEPDTAAEPGKDDLPPWVDIMKGKAQETDLELPGEEMKPLDEEEDAIREADTADEDLGSVEFIPGDTLDFQKEVLKGVEESAQPRSSTMGIPETVAKTAIPAARKRALRLDEEEGEVDLEEEVQDKAEDIAAEVTEPKLGLFGHLKAFLFDLAFVALFWFVAVGMAARLMGVGFVPLVKAASLPVSLLFLALFAGYFFLFLFFLGETLGRRLVTPKD